MENSQGNWEKPPTSPTMDGTAVAMMVLSRATRPVQSIRAASTGPRSERKPTPLEVAGGLVVVTYRLSSGVGAEPPVPVTIQAATETGPGTTTLERASPFQAIPGRNVQNDRGEPDGGPPAAAAGDDTAVP